MSRVALKGLLFRRSRTILTALAIVLGVAMVSGTYVLTDTITRAFDGIFNASYERTSAVITRQERRQRIDRQRDRSPSRWPRGSAGCPASPPPPGAIFDLEAPPTRRRSSAATARRSRPAARRPSASASNPTQTRFNPMTLTAGHWAAADGEVVIDQGTADKRGLRGRRHGSASPPSGPAPRFTISGIAKFGSVASLGGATIAVFTVPEAQRLLDKEGRVDLIFVAAKPGVTRRQRGRCRSSRSCPRRPRSAPAPNRRDENSKDVNDVPADHPLLPARLRRRSRCWSAPSSPSTPSRSRSRSGSGSSRRCARSAPRGGRCCARSWSRGSASACSPRWSASFAGLGLAKGLNALFDALGLSLPTTSLVFETRTVVVSLLLGIGVTMVSSLVPALRATRIPPVAAMREGATLPPSRVSRRRGPIVAVVLAPGARPARLRLLRRPRHAARRSS